MAGYYTLSESYDLGVTPLNAQTAGITSFPQRKLRINFAWSAVPAGTTTTDLVMKTSIYSPDTSGTWQLAPLAEKAFNLSNASLIDSYIEFTPPAPGRFVVAYKP
jgi:hypothetical protein